MRRVLEHYACLNSSNIGHHLWWNAVVSSGQTCTVALAVMLGSSWAELDLREKRGVKLQAYTQFCPAAKYLQSNQIAAFQASRSHLFNTLLNYFQHGS